MSARLRIAAAQFPVSGDLRRNLRFIHRQMRLAARKGADIVHFPETALPGYAPTHLDGYLEQYPWEELERGTRAVCDLAKILEIWVVMGSMRRPGVGLPRNSTLVISPAGAIHTYDKRELYGSERALYGPGEAVCVVRIRDVRCGFLICYENCFPALHVEYQRLGVQILFHSFYNAANSKKTSVSALMSAMLITRAADHGMWISAANSSESFSPLAACIVRPDGSSVSCKRHRSGLAIADYPSSLGWTPRITKAG